MKSIKLIAALSLALGVNLGAAGCSKDDKKETDKAAAEKPGEEKPGEPTKTDAVKPAPPADKPEAKKPTVEKAKRLAGTNSKKVMCSNDSLMLTKYSFKELQDGKFCDECKEFDEDACGLDWPSSDMMPCGEYDVMRNGIYAAYGNTFSKEKWQKRFAKESWYKATGKVDELALPVVAQKNIKYLKDEAAVCRKDPARKSL